MDLAETRTALHGAAELLLAGPQHSVSDTVRLRVIPGGLATTREPDIRLLGDLLVAPGGSAPLAGTYADVAAAVGLVPRPLDGVYDGGPRLGPEARADVDPALLAQLVEALERGDAALRLFAPDLTPVLWPEHLDVAIVRDEVNYGVSPGDDVEPEPYAYVGPWTPRNGPFWNQSFGASRRLTELPDPAAVAAFFDDGRRRAALDG